MINAIGCLKCWNGPAICTECEARPGLFPYVKVPAPLSEDDRHSVCVLLSVEGRECVGTVAPSPLAVRQESPGFRDEIDDMVPVAPLSAVESIEASMQAAHGVIS